MEQLRKTWESVKAAWEAFQELIVGFSFSLGGSYILKEGVHMLFVVVTTILSTVALHYTKIWLNRRKNENKPKRD